MIKLKKRIEEKNIIYNKKMSMLGKNGCTVEVDESLMASYKYEKDTPSSRLGHLVWFKRSLEVVIYRLFLYGVKNNTNDI